MKGSIRQSARRIPEGAYHRALKAEAEVVEGDLNDLLWDLLLYRHAVQRIVDALWDLDKIPNRSQALALIKATKKSNGNKPVLRKLSARLDYQDAKVKLDKGIIRVTLRSQWYALRFKQRKEYIDRFKALGWKEVHVKYENGKLYVSIVFEIIYEPYTPRGIIALDINLRTVTAYDGSKIRRFRTRFIDPLSKKKRSEELQKKYSKRWKYNEKILNRVRALQRKARNIVVDWCWKLTKRVVLKALRHRYAVALENLGGLRESVNSKSDEFTWKLAMFAYRRLQHSIISKAIEYEVPVVIVDPRNTSSICPRCSEKLVYIHRLATCRRCGFKADRDSVGAVNIWLRALQAYAGEPGSPPRAPAMKNETRQSRGITREGMKKTIRAIHR
jgi:putative transposase